MTVRIVVAGAVIREYVDGPRLLLAQRDYPAELAALWELPGGKTEAGETDAEALVRELREELGIDVVAGVMIGTPVTLRAGLELHAYRAHWIEGEPMALEHRQVAWVTALQLQDLAGRGAMVPADVGWLPELARLLRRRAPS